MKIKISAASNGRSRECEFFESAAKATESPELIISNSYDDADIIFVTDLHHRNLYADVLRRPEHRHNYNKLICYYEHEFPPDMVPGIYSCGSKDSNAARGAPFFFWLRTHPFDREVGDLQNRRYLFSFMGRQCNALRRKIIQLKVSDPSICYLLEDTTFSFPLFSPIKVAEEDVVREQRRRFFDVMSKTKFVLAPKGTGLSSIRQYEAMAVGCVPVVLSDKLKQPFAIDWSKCAVNIPESEVDTIPYVLRELEPQYPQMSLAAQSAYESLFEPNNYWKYIQSAIIDIYESDMGRRAPVSVLRRAIAYRAIRRTFNRRKNDIKRFVIHYFR